MLPTTDGRPAGSSGSEPRGEQVANLAFYGLYALQHRGQESAGIAAADGRSVLVYKDMGLVSQVFDEPALATLQGHLAIGHTRYSTTGASRWENAQPVFRTNAAGGGIALAHNGNLTNTAALAAELGYRGQASSDTELVAELLARGEADRSLEALTETAAGTGATPGDRGLCTVCLTRGYPILIPDAAGPDLPPAATQPSTLPLPNP
jgi:glutamine phosphoribosylpyrophosphate amidotransferase